MVLTHCDCVINFEAAQDLTDVSGIQKATASHNYLEFLCKNSLQLISMMLLFFTHSSLFLNKNSRKLRNKNKNNI